MGSGNTVFVSALVLMATSWFAAGAAAEINCPSGWKEIEPASNAISVQTEAGGQKSIVSCRKPEGELSRFLLFVVHTPGANTESSTMYVISAVAMITSSGMRWSDSGGSLSAAVSQWGFEGHNSIEEGSMPTIHGDVEYMILEHEDEDCAFFRNHRHRSGSRRSIIQGSICYAPDFVIKKDLVEQFVNSIGIRNEAGATATLSNP